MDFDDKKMIEIYLNGGDLAFDKILQKYLKPVFNFIHQLVTAENIQIRPAR